MAGYRTTQIRKPADETEFEKNCVVLFKELLSDPNVSRVGTRGQGQNGVDIKGHRDRDPNQMVGIQCKLKAGNSKLTKREVDDEVKKALTFKPPLQEYFIVTTSKNHTKLMQRAAALMQEQEVGGRRIHIEVWGWDTLEEHINKHETAKQAFDPGFSPALAAQDRKLDALIEGQSRQPTKDDLAALASKLDKERADIPAQLPERIADRELREELSKALRRRGFARSDTPGELAALAARAADGDLALGSPALRAEVFERAARANAVPKTQATAVAFRNQAAAADPSRDLFIIDALLNEAAGDSDAALRHLKSRNDIEARSALFAVLMRQKGTEAALEWARAENLSAGDFTPPSALNLLLKTIETEEFEIAQAFAMEVPSTYFGEIAALLLLRAQLRLASILPEDQKAAIFQGLPINPGQLQLASGPRAADLAKAALADIQALISQTSELGVEYLDDYLGEFALWLRLEIADEHIAARAQLTAEISDPELTLRRVRLALAYDVPFDAAALQRNLVRRKEIGGWSSDERFAAFLLAFHKGEPKTIVEFFEANHDDLFTQSDLATANLAAIEIEATARAGRIEDARGLIQQHLGSHLTDEQVKDIDEQIAAIERDDELETHRRRYEQTGSLSELRVLVSGLRAKNDVALLATYAPVLARATQTRLDFDTAIKSLYHARRDAELIELANNLPDLTELDLEYESIRGWALYRLGRVMEARDIGRKLFASRNDGNDRELAINTAIETGDWGNLQGTLAHEVARIDALSANDCMRLARLGFEINSPYVNQFRDAALAKAPDDPQVHLAAYVLATERGEEDHGAQAHQWFQKAVALSGPDGPVQTVSFREVVDHTSGWRERTDKVDKAFRQAEIPAFMAVRAVNRRLLDLTLGQAHRNLDAQDTRLSFPVLAFSGAKVGVELRTATTAALDITTLITLEYLGHLQEALDYFRRVVISPSTLTFLFAERQFIRVQQPSQVAKARRIQALIASGRLKVVPRRGSNRTAADKEIGEEMATLLDTAAADGGVVVRSGPVTKLGSYLDETADMSRYVAVLTDTHAVLALLSADGKIEGTTRQSADAYLRHVDKGWDSAPPISSRSTLYLDDLTVTYLDYLGLLDALTVSVGNVFVHADVSDQVHQTLRYSEHTNELLVGIEHIRAALAAGVESGHVAFSPRQSSTERADDEGEDPKDFSPTLDLLSDLAKVDVAVVDDRCLNKLPNWRDSAGRTVPCANTLDILIALRISGQLDETGYWRARHRLRVGGFYAVPLEVGELAHWLAAAPVAEGAVRETPELRAIRESIALPQINDVFLAQEEPWLIGIRFAISKAIRQTWIEAKDYNIAEAHANWLRSITPDPRGWCPDPDSEAAWATARQQAAIQIAILMVFTEGKKDRRRRYFEWLEANIIAPVRKVHPETWDAVLSALKSYLTQLWEVDKSGQQQDLLTELFVNPLPAPERMKLLLDEMFRAKLGIKPQFWYPLGKTQSVEVGSLHKALRGAIADRRTASLTLKDRRRVRVKLGRQKGGSATFMLGNEGFAFTNADLLSAGKNVRLAALDRVFRAKPLLAEEESGWHDIAAHRGLTDREYDELMTTLGHTPEAYSAELAKPHELSSESLMPDSPAYYDRLVAPLRDSTNMASFMQNELARARQSILERNPARAVRRIAYSALWQPFVPFDLLAALTPADISPLLAAEDPFSLLFGFELCRAFLEKDSGYADLGTSFLKKLFGDKDATLRRCELFTACAVVATTGFRPRARAAGSPVFWTRLAALTHAGVLTDGLSRIPDTKDFLRWSIDHFYPFYIWHGVVDRRETPRWKPEWISPDHIFAELVGRVGGALDMLPKERRPAAWVAAVDSSVEQLRELTSPLAAVFPGPFDDFRQSQPKNVWNEAVAEIEEQLAQASSLADAPGLAAMAFASVPSEQAVVNVLRIVSTTAEEPFTDAKTELPHLQTGAHFALAARSEAIAQAITQRCFLLMRSAPEMVTDLFAVIATACAVNGDSRQYRTAIGEHAARACFLVDDAGALGNLLAVFGVLVDRDERLGAALAKAQAVARTKLGRI